MNVSSPCEICGGLAVEHTCDRCGSLVCEDHYSTETGLCVECTAEVGGGDQPQSAEDLPDGVDTYQF
jgi:hypothetical protein